MDKGFVIWFTGIPSSGKSTIARGVAERLREDGFKVIVLESDELRKFITPNPKYTEEERDIFYRSLATMGMLLADNGFMVLIDATAHKREYRDYARSLIKNFIEVYVYCPLETCIKRDAKGLYRRALKGEIKTLPGLQVDYEEPLNPEIIVDTDKMDIKESVDYVYRRIINILDRERNSRHNSNI